MAEQSDEQTLTENTVSGTVNRRPPTKVRIQIAISSYVSLALVSKSQLSVQVGIYRLVYYYDHVTTGDHMMVLWYVAS